MNGETNTLEYQLGELIQSIIQGNYRDYPITESQDGNTTKEAWNHSNDHLKSISEKAFEWYRKDFEQNVLNPFQQWEEAFERYLTQFYELIWNGCVSLTPSGTEIKKFNLEEEMGKSNNQPLTIDYWCHCEMLEKSLRSPYDIKNGMAQFKELLTRGLRSEDNQEYTANPRTVYLFFYNLSLFIERVRYYVINDRMNISFEEFCERCFLQTKDLHSRIYNQEAIQNMIQQKEDVIFQNAIELFEKKKEVCIENFIGNLPELKKLKDRKGINIIIGSGKEIEKRFKARNLIKKKERLYIAGRLSLFVEKVQERPKKKYPTIKSIQNESLVKNKPQSDSKTSIFLDLLKQRGSSPIAKEEGKSLKCIQLLDSLTVKETKYVVTNSVEPTTLPPPLFLRETNQLESTVNMLSSIIQNYMQQVSNRTNALNQFKQTRFQIMKRRLSTVGNGEYLMDYRTSLLLRQTKKRLKYLLSQPNHRVSMEKKEEAIVAYLRLVTPYIASDKSF